MRNKVCLEPKNVSGGCKCRSPAGRDNSALSEPLAGVKGPHHDGGKRDEKNERENKGRKYIFGYGIG